MNAFDNLTQQFDRNIAWFEQVAGSQITSSIKSVKNDIIFVEKTIDRLSVAVPQPLSNYISSDYE